MIDFILESFYAILSIYFGYLCIKFRGIIGDWTGNFDLAEKYLGRGGTDLVIILFGMLLIFFGVMIPFGGISSLLINN